MGKGEITQKKKLLIMSNLSFSHSVFYLIGEFQPYSSNIKLSSGNFLSLGESKICRLVKLPNKSNIVGCELRFSNGGDGGWGVGLNIQWRVKQFCTCVNTLLHYGSLPFTSVVGSESRPSSLGIFVT